MPDYRSSERIRKILLFLLPRGTRALHRDLIIKFVEGCIYRDMCPRWFARRTGDALSCPVAEDCPCKHIYVERKRLYRGSKISLRPKIRTSYDRTLRQMRKLNLVQLADASNPNYGFFYNLTRQGIIEAKKVKRQVKDLISTYERFLEERYWTQEIVQ